MTIVVTGATGKVGGYLVNRLQQTGAEYVAASRTPKGTRARKFDWNDTSTWDALLTDATRLWIVPQAEGVYDVSATIEKFVHRALERSAIEQIGLLSVRNAEQLNKDLPSLKLEHMLAGLEIPWFSLRPTWFYQNFAYGMFARGIQEHRKLLAPTQDGAVSFIDADDIAACAQSALTSIPAVTGIHELSGPSSLTFAELAQTLTSVLGRTIEHADVDDEEMTVYLQGNGLVSAHIAALINHFARIRDGGSGAVEPGVQLLLGRPALSFADYLAREPEAVAALSTRS
ncbi:NAD-dependent epimerase/dehydratase family protein [Rhodococcus globerulus]|uniref:NAD-dependent epimerase/dehydratase family protein n=1 Tax=Rhodococcus globerulus TaxID=33008 RepID=UPI000526573C|nr:NAD-dependent epimerase/dehydratase family protein [Rhodococcus globerulus]PVX59588.1 uncharacterized protein YbjT (DUF2867 family) [Rhodococcus globerulus]